MEPKYYLMDIAIEVDDNKSYKFEAKCVEDETVSECFVPQSKNDELVKLFKSGNKVNFKIGNLDLYFSLSGFSKAFSRASRLVKQGFNKKSCHIWQEMRDYLSNQHQLLKLEGITSSQACKVLI